MNRYAEAVSNAERCLICGATIPEGSQVCVSCMKEHGIDTTEAVEVAEQLRDIAGVLKITKDTDANIKQSMESLLSIADRLERKKKCKEKSKKQQRSTNR